jgi:hypothetical protein
MLAVRGGLACAGGVPMLPLLAAGYRVVAVECAPPKTSRPRTALIGRALVHDVLCGLEQHLKQQVALANGAAAAGAAGARRSSPERMAVGVMGCGLGGLLALHAVAWSERFDACVCAGAPVSERWVDLEGGACAAFAAGVAPDEANGGRMSKPAAFAGSAAAAEFEMQNMLSRTATHRAPTLLLYADADARCPLSQAHAAYHALCGRRAPTPGEAADTQLVVYHGDTNALRLPAHRRDAARRTCTWFGTHLTGERKQRPPVKSAAAPAPAAGAPKAKQKAGGGK